MSLLSEVKYNCKYFESAKPCRPHKQYGVFCDACEYFSPVESRVLIIKFAAAGDVLRTTSVLPAIHQKHSNANVYWITAKNAAPMFQNNSLVNFVLTEPAEYLPLLDIVEFDAVYNLEADSYSSLLTAKARAKEKFGFTQTKENIVRPINPEAGEWFMMGINDRLKKENSKTYFQQIYSICKLNSPVVPPALFLSQAESELTEHFRTRYSLGTYKRVIGINTGSGKRWPLKKWGFESYCELLEKLHNAHPEVALVLFGGPEEVEFNQDLKTKLSFEIIDAGTDNSLRKFFALIDAVDILLTPDSLAMHVGIALHKNVVVYTGPTSSAELDVFGKGAILHADLPCLVCYLNECDKTTNCMNSLSVEQMYTAISKYL